MKTPVKRKDEDSVKGRVVREVTEPSPFVTTKRKFLDALRPSLTSVVQPSPAKPRVTPLIPPRLPRPATAAAGRQTPEDTCTDSDGSERSLPSPVIFTSPVMDNRCRITTSTSVLTVSVQIP